MFKIVFDNRPTSLKTLYYCYVYLYSLSRLATNCNVFISARNKKKPMSTVE